MHPRFFLALLVPKEDKIVCISIDASSMLPPCYPCNCWWAQETQGQNPQRQIFSTRRRCCQLFTLHCFPWSKVRQPALTYWQLPAFARISPMRLGPVLSSAHILSKRPQSITRDLNAASKCENIGRCPIYWKRNISTSSPLGSIWSTSDLLFVLFILSHLSAIQLSGHTAHTLKPRV